MFIKIAKRIISLGLSFILVLVLAIGIIPSEKAHAASFSDINNSTMFFKQNTSSTCTLSSAAMLVRRAALLSGNSNWTAVTENNLKSTAWLSGTGLYNSFSYAGINVSSAKISSNRTQTMINLLSQHPEGIVIYDYGKPHAILLTDYTNGTFYCADPSSAAPAGRIPISQATITLESMDKYWYVASPKLSMSVTQPVNIKPTVGNVQITSSNGYTSYSCQVTTGMGGAWATVEFTRDGVKSDPVSAEIVNGTVSGYVSRFSSTLTVKVTVTDQAGNTASNETSVDYGDPVRLSANRLSLMAGDSDRVQWVCADLYELNGKSGDSCQLSDGRTAVEISDEGVVSAHLPGQYVLWYKCKYTQYNPPESDFQPAMVGFGDRGIRVDVRLESPVVQTLSADTAGNVYIDFSSARGADGYEVCRTSEDGKITETVRVSGSGKHCVGHDLPDDTKWNYKVRAYTILPEENHNSGRIDSVTGKILTYMPEETIYSDWTQTYSISTINLAATMEPIVNNILGSVTASWRKVPSAEGYLVYRTEGKAGENRKLLTIAEAGETTYTDNTVIPGTFYTYEIIPYLGTEFGTCDNAITVCAKAENPGEGTEQPGIDSPVTFSIEPFANLDYTFQTIDGDTVSSKVLPTKDVTLLVFGRTTCASSWLTLRSIAESSWVQDPKVSVIYVDIEGADAEVIRSSIDYYAQLSEDTSKYYLGCEKIVFCQDADGKNDEARKMYHTLSGKWGTISLPMTILVDKKNIVREMLTGYQIADKILPVMNKVIVKGNAAEEEDKKDDTDKDDTGTGDTGNDNTGTGDSQKKPMAVRAEQVRLSKTNLTFNGKAQTPAVIARDSQGRQINSADYTVTYSNNINVGQATATITFRNNYTGIVKKTFLIMPKGTNISRLTPKKKGLTVKWRKQNSQINGYEIQYSVSRNFKGAKTVKISKVKTASKKISRLKAKKRYYVRIRTYKTAKVDGMNLKLYSRWSKAKSVKTKK